MFTHEITVRHVVTALSLFLLFLGLAWVFYAVVGSVLRRLAHKAAVHLGGILTKAAKWPLVSAIILTGLYSALASLPVRDAIDFEVSRGFHVAYIFVAAWGLVAAVDGLCRWFKSEVTSKTNTPVDDWITLFVRLVSPFVIAAMAVLAGLELFGINVEAYKSWLTTYGIHVGSVAALTIAALFLLGIVGSRAISVLMARGPAKQSEEEIRKRANTVSGVLLTTGQVVIITIAVFVVLSEFDIDIAPALAGAGVLGIAVGFGAQSLIKDLIAGFFVVMENQYRVGDVVNIAGVGGLVEEINLRRTVLRDMDGIVHVIPNGEVKVASNHTKEYSRVNLNISVSYGTDLDAAIGVINRVLQGNGSGTRMGRHADQHPAGPARGQAWRLRN